MTDIVHWLTFPTSIGRIKADDPINIISTSLQEYHQKNKVTYSFGVQLLQNLDEQSVEEWVFHRVPKDHIVQPRVEVVVPLANHWSSSSLLFVNSIGIEWNADKYPFEEVATLEFEPQDSWRPEFRNWWDDKITVNSWHGLKEHQPLGSTNRLRRVVVSAVPFYHLVTMSCQSYHLPILLKTLDCCFIWLLFPSRNAYVRTLRYYHTKIDDDSLGFGCAKYAESRKLRLKVNGYKDYIEPSSLKEVPVGPISVKARAWSIDSILATC